jgi:osmotically-inducible protein OsmY
MIRRKEMKRFVLLTVLVVFGLTLFAGCAAITGRTTGEFIDDQTITAQADKIIIKEPGSDFWKIDVESTNGNVVLMGYVDSRQAEDRVVGKIRDLRGVKSVTSHLTLEKQ